MTTFCFGVYIVNKSVVLVQVLMETSVEGGQVVMLGRDFPAPLQCPVQTRGGTQAQLLVLAAQAGSTLISELTSEVGVIPVYKGL
jgi:hypothetical protein